MALAGWGLEGIHTASVLTIYFKLGFRIAPDRVKTLSQIDTCKAMFTFQKEKREQRENKRSFFSPHPYLVGSQQLRK